MLLIYSLGKYLFDSYCVPGTVLREYTVCKIKNKMGMTDGSRGMEKKRPGSMQYVWDADLN